MANGAEDTTPKVVEALTGLMGAMGVGVPGAAPGAEAKAIMLPRVAVMVVLPRERPSASPAPVMLATLGAEEVQTTEVVRFTVRPAAK